MKSFSIHRSVFVLIVITIVYPANGAHVAISSINIKSSEFSLRVIDDMGFPADTTSLFCNEVEAFAENNMEQDQLSDLKFPPDFAQARAIVSGANSNALAGHGSFITPPFYQEAYSYAAPPEWPAPHFSSADAESTCKFAVSPVSYPITILYVIPFDWSLVAQVDDPSKETARAYIEIQCDCLSTFPDGTQISPVVPTLLWRKEVTADFQRSDSFTITGTFTFPQMSMHQLLTGTHTFDLMVGCCADIDTVPEPCTLSMLAVGGLLVFKRRSIREIGRLFAY